MNRNIYTAMGSLEQNNNFNREEKEQRYKEMKDKLYKQDERIRTLQSSAFQLANFYFVFQGVILTSIFNSSGALATVDRSFLFLLSLLAALLNLCVFYTTARKCMKLMNEHDKNLDLCAKLRSELIEPRGTTTGPLDVDKFDKFKRGSYLVLCMAFLLIFTLLTLVGCWVLHREDDKKMCCGSQSPQDNNVDQNIGRVFKLCEGIKKILGMEIRQGKTAK
ncbi:uncharacterized protein LOC131152377 isoform X2 [Malania oleifera]|uniref:uncharacterized protein LOC131152377 isoform X2 n=1 Tax=Malania oleifera TaxID=397392 RepID=UPI0025AEAC11|nr:uncharacterized protein LOC131152377 isoform X2 [Malania oleifera]